MRKKPLEKVRSSKVIKTRGELKNEMGGVEFEVTIEEHADWADEEIIDGGYIDDLSPIIVLSESDQPKRIKKPRYSGLVRSLMLVVSVLGWLLRLIKRWKG